jgi:hypothetical protein
MIQAGGREIKYFGKHFGSAGPFRRPGAIKTGDNSFLENAG